VGLVTPAAPTSRIPPQSALSSATSGARLAAAVVVGAALAAALGWLMARVIWLPLFAGVFFYLIEGLLVGAASFRIARPARPLGRAAVAACIALITLAGAAAGLTWEHRYVVHTAGDPPRFADAWATAPPRRAGRSTVQAAASETMRQFLYDSFPPGGIIGYVRWAVRDGSAAIELPGGFRDTVHLGTHRGPVWLGRTLAAAAMFAAGLWAQLESLRSALPVNNILAPGQEADDSDNAP